MSIKVGNLGPSKGIDKARKSRKTGAASDGSFSEALQETASPGATSGAHETHGAHGVDNILGLQEVGSATDGASRGKALAHGNDLLDRLEQLRLAILRGAVPKERLQDLAQRLRQRRGTVDDPRLDELLQEIELRCEVEIAKLTRRL